MSLISKLTANRSSERLLKSGLLSFSANTANYSRRSNSEDLDAQYKIVKSKVRVEDANNWNGLEGGPNWELFSPKGNRFFLPGSLGPAWQSATTTISSSDILLNDLVDFQSQEYNKLHINSKSCPVLLRNNLHELFPAPEVFNKGPLTIITLSYNINTDEDQGAKEFVIAAREICTRLRLNGYWADFMNPFSGKPFYSYASGKRLYKIDERFRGLSVKLEEQNECLVISSDQEISFSGSVFTNASSDLNSLSVLLKNSEQCD